MPNVMHTGSRQMLLLTISHLSLLFNQLALVREYRAKSTRMRGLQGVVFRAWHRRQRFQPDASALEFLSKFIP